VSSTVHRALAEYVSMRKGIITDDDAVARYWAVMKSKGWSVRNATITCKTSTVVEELPK
jgi:uncharacterized protein YqjF (DUF2071 family)